MDLFTHTVDKSFLLVILQSMSILHEFVSLLLGLVPPDELELASVVEQGGVVPRSPPVRLAHQVHTELGHIVVRVDG